MDNPNKIQIIEMPFFMIEKVRLSWHDRLLSWPWRPWVKSYPVRTPSMIKIDNNIYCHPNLASSVHRMVEHRDDAGNGCCDCEWTWVSATSNGLCEFCDKRQWF